MDKLKKFLAIPLAYHVAMYLAYAILNGTSTSMMVITFDIIFGVTVTPVYLAVISVAHAILHEGKVYDYIYNCLGYLGIIGILRVLLYVVFQGGMTSVGVAGVCFAASVGVFAIWDTIFALTDRMMKKRPGRKNKKY